MRRWFLMALVMVLLVGCAKEVKAPASPRPAPAQSGPPPAPEVRKSESGPYLERVNLVTGEQQRLVAVASEVIEAHLSPDKGQVALRAWEKPADPVQGWRPTGTYLVDLEQRRMTRLQMGDGTLSWAGGRLFSNLFERSGQQPGYYVYDPAAGGEPVRHGEWLGWGWGLSPDGRTVAYLGEPFEASGEASWNSLILMDLQTGKKRTVERFVRGWSFGKEGDWTLWVAWSPDGQRIAALDPVERFGRTDVMVYDLTRNERQVVRRDLDIRVWGYRLAFSPDGQNLLASGWNPTLVIPLTGQGAPVALQEHGMIPAFWDARGERVLTAGFEWGPVYVYTLKTGQQQALGEGRPVGWDGDWVYLIRWVESDSRYIPPGL